MKNTALGITLAALGFVGCGSAQQPRVFLATTNNIDDVEVNRLLAANPIAEGQATRVLPLRAAEGLSYHLVQIRDREQPHIHAKHDATITMLAGSGELHVGTSTVAMKASDSAILPRGVPHYFVNTATEVAVAVVTFSPPLMKPDTVPVDK